jgi:ubiquinone/menaquinone biosynthesis C-methylase UbiE
MKLFYDRYCCFYKYIEKILDALLDKIIENNIQVLQNTQSKTILEYGCGTGLLTLKLSPLFKTIHARDLSDGMINRAQERAIAFGINNVTFTIGNILEPDEALHSYDYVFLSFILHLFPPEVEIIILKKLLGIAKKAVIVIDHARKWELFSAIIEWIEGSYYDKFRKLDFREIGKQIGARKADEDHSLLTVLIFWK